MEASFFDERSMYQIYFNVEPGFGYYLPENASVKVIRPAGYGSGTVHDPITYSTLYKDDWIEESSISRKYRTERWLEPTSQLKEYGTDIRIQEPKVGDPTTNQWGHMTNLRSEKIISLSSGSDLRAAKNWVMYTRKNSGEFKINGKYVNSWMDNMDFTDGHIWHVYCSYEVVDPSASGSVSGTVKSYNSTTEPGTESEI
jgi:hypothetical protein